MKRLLSLVTILALAFAVSCGGDENNTGIPGDPPDKDNTDGDSPEEPVETSNRAGYVFNQVVVPTTTQEANAVALDIDGNGTVDNSLGKVISTLASVGGDGFDAQGSIDKSLADGTVILLANLGYNSFDTGGGLLSLFEGDSPGTAPCDGDSCGKHLQGGTSFQAAAVSNKNTVPGTLATGVFTGSGGAVSIPLPLLAGEPISVNVIEAAATATVTKDSMTNGIIGGGITEDEIRNTIIPAIADALAVYTATECTGTAPNCCVEGSSGQQIMDLFDENSDCEVTADELNNNTLITTLLKPDLDLLDENGDINPGVDGVLDSISIGLGFSSINAEFDLP